MVQISVGVTQYALEKIPPMPGVFAKIRPGGAQMHKIFIYNGLEILILLALSVDFISFDNKKPCLLSWKLNKFLIVVCLLLSVLKDFKKCFVIFVIKINQQ